MTIVLAVVALLIVAGVVGSAVPMLPGTPLIVAGALLYALVTDFTPVGVGRLLILAALSVVGMLLNQVASAVGVRQAGASRWAIAGALVGAVVGLFAAPLGLLLGPLLGAIAGEILRTGHVRQSARAGVGAVVGLLAGAVAQVAMALVMVGLFVWWVWRG
jgi:uncharacterized protein YqgC (DUF456 family)